MARGFVAPAPLTFQRWARDVAPSSSSSSSSSSKLSFFSVGFSFVVFLFYSLRSPTGPSIAEGWPEAKTALEIVLEIALEIALRGLFSLGMALGMALDFAAFRWKSVGGHSLTGFQLGK